MDGESEVQVQHRLLRGVTTGQLHLPALDTLKPR